MPFPSYAFLFAFLPAALAGYFLLGRRDPRSASPWLGACSLLFLLLNDSGGDTLTFLVVAGWIAFLVGGAIVRRRAAGLPTVRLLATGLGLLALLALVSGRAPSWLGWGTAPWALSFVAFSQAAHLLDVHRGGPAARGLWSHLSFSAFFPKLPAGPPQSFGAWEMERARPEAARFQPRNVAPGLGLFAFGLAKKAVLADSLSLLSRHLFDDLAPQGAPGLLFAWAGALAFAFQIYFELSGFADMALGLARMFNVALPPVFDAPYRARTVSAFWSRWYAPLWNFGRGLAALLPPGARAAAAPLAFVALGLWHGPTAPFLAWGAWSGLCVAVQRSGRVRVPGWAAGGLTFLAAFVGWVFFRSGTLQEAGAILAALIGCGPRGESPARQLAPLFLGSEAKEYALAFLALAASPFLAFLGPTSERLFGPEWRPTWRGAAAVAAALVLAVLFLPSAREFFCARF